MTTIDLFLAALREGFIAAGKWAEFLATSQGQAVVEKCLKDQAKAEQVWDAFVKQIKDGWDKLAGDLKELK
jgi:hypothetical protein